MSNFIRCSGAALFCGGILAQGATAQVFTDECGGSPPALVVGTPLQGHNANMTDSVADGGTCGGSSDVFATFTPAQTGLYLLSTCGSGANINMTVYTGCPVTPDNAIACGDTYSAEACGTAAVVYDEAELVLIGGTTYVIRLASLDDLQGSITLSATVITPVNDLCPTAILINSTGVTQVWSAGATGPDDLTTCVVPNAPDLWFRFRAPATGWYDFTLVNPAAGNTLLTTGAMAMNDECGGDLLTCDPVRMKHQMTAGQHRYIRVYAPASEPAIALSIQPGTAPCAADFDASGAVDVSDIFAFLSAWFNQGPGADFNNSGAIDVSDIFAFLSAWFQGC